MALGSRKGTTKRVLCKHQFVDKTQGPKRGGKGTSAHNGVHSEKKGSHLGNRLISSPSRTLYGMSPSEKEEGFHQNDWAKTDSKKGTARISVVPPKSGGQCENPLASSEQNGTPAKWGRSILSEQWASGRSQDRNLYEGDFQNSLEEGEIRGSETCGKTRRAGPATILLHMANHHIEKRGDAA